jgi:hypothetical protein
MEDNQPVTYLLRSKNPVKALGIFFGHSKEEYQNLNWEKKIEEMKNQFTA